MNFGHRGATNASWHAWEREHTTVSDEALEIAPTVAPVYRESTFVSPRQPQPAWVDVAVDRSGNVFLLDASGQIHRLRCDDSGRIDRLDCRTHERADPRAIGVSDHTIFVAVGNPGQVRAYSREPPGLRWVETDVGDPVALAPMGDGMAVLDRGDTPGNGTVWSLSDAGNRQQVVVDLAAPVDMAVDPNGAMYILDHYQWPSTATERGHVLRRIPPQALDYPPVTGLESVVVPPNGFRLEDDGAYVTPTSLVADQSDAVVLGSDPTEDATAISRLHPSIGRCQRHAELSAGTEALAIDRSDDMATLYVIDQEGTLRRAAGRFERVHDPDTDTSTGIGRTRFDAGAEETTWHRISIDWDDAREGTGVGLRYAATDDPEPQRLAVMPENTSTDLTSIKHIGRRNAWRLRTAGVETVGEVAELDPETLATLLGVEEITVPPEDIEDWHDQAADLIAAGEDRLRSVEGIGRAFAERLAVGGIETLEELVEEDIDTLASLLGSRIRRFGVERAREAIEDAAGQLSPHGTPEELTWTRAPKDPTDVLLDGAEGRYLWVSLELTGTARTTPTVSSMTAEYPRQSYLDDLPSIYRTDASTAATLEPLLALFERIFTDVEHNHATLLTALDPGGIPPDFLEWVGETIGAELDPHWPVAARRAFLARSRELFRMRGTRRGLAAVIDLYVEHIEVDTSAWSHARPETDVEPFRIVEFGDLACARDTPAWEPYGRMIATASGFLVLVHPALEPNHVDAIGRIVRNQQPAHTRGRAVALRPRMMLTGHEEGDRTMHAYLGVNTCLTDQAFTVEQSLLGEETKLREREPYASLGVRSRLDEESRLS